MGVKRTNKQVSVTQKRDAKAISSNLLQMKKKRKVLKLQSKTVNYSVCIPTTILDGCKNLEQITQTLYQVARSACIFNVGEVIILEVPKNERQTEDIQKNQSNDKPASKIKFDRTSKEAVSTKLLNESHRAKSRKLPTSMLIASLLQYFVTPPYLVKSVFKKEYMHNFKYAKELPRITSLPFMRYYKENDGRYREGLAIRMRKPGEAGKSKKEFSQTKYINIGKDRNLELKGQLVPVNVRVTVDTLEKKVISPEEAYGDYVGVKSSFGYHVRISKSFADLFVSSPHSEGYTQTVWINSGDFYFDPSTNTNKKIESKIPALQKVIKPTIEEIQQDSNGITKPTNLLTVFGKWKDLNSCFQLCRDQFEGVQGIYQFFDGQLDLPGATPEGNIRIEDGCTIALTALSML